MNHFLPKMLCLVASLYFYTNTTIESRDTSNIWALFASTTSAFFLIKLWLNLGPLLCHSYARTRPDHSTLELSAERSPTTCTFSDNLFDMHMKIRTLNLPINSMRNPLQANILWLWLFLVCRWFLLLDKCYFYECARFESVLAARILLSWVRVAGIQKQRYNGVSFCALWYMPFACSYSLLRYFCCCRATRRTCRRFVVVVASRVFIGILLLTPTPYMMLYTLSNIQNVPLKC